MWPDTARPELDGCGEMVAQVRFDGLEEPESVLDAVGITEQPKARDAVGGSGHPGLGQKRSGRMATKEMAA